MAASVAAAVNINGIKILFANALSVTFIKRKPVSSNGLEALAKNLPDCTTLCN